MNRKEFENSFALMLTGDKEAFTNVYNEMKNPVFTIINRIVNNRYESEDIMQELFLRLLSKREEFRVKNPRAYLFMMARNMAIDNLRKYHPDYLDEEMADSEGSQFEDRVCLTASVEEAILQLGVKEREVLTLHINAEMKFKDIAASLGEPLGTITSRYKSAIQKLRMIMRGEKI